ncbi:protocadherin gamma-B2-like [Bombina bombina]|uniref:protocadherin gamma-B2-like n=1 Tax=Bombina bombina TaxID=8345 RepID=UPI00235A96E4|nr:protocadherin gamma-B2-like [Bombina bombina]
MAEEKKHQAQKCWGIRWQVLFLFLLTWLCHLVTGQLQYSIFEEIRKDSVITNIAKDIGIDVKEFSFRKPRIVSRVSEKYFAVNLENGNLYVKDRIDRETLCGAVDSCDLTFDLMIANPLKVFNVRIEILDVNDNPPIFFHDPVMLEISESSMAGVHFYLQHAEDPDSGSNSVQSYKLKDSQHFTLSERTNGDGSKFPELVLEKSLDREAQSIYDLILTALDGGNPAKTGTALIKIIVTDANDNIPIFNEEVYKVSISEHTPVNSTVVYVIASDKDEGSNGQITYSFSKTAGNSLYIGIFSIDPVNGEIKTKESLDFEKAKTYELSIQAKDGGGLVTHSRVLIEIIDENDNAPEISVMSISTPIAEDSVVGTVIAIIEVHDQDSGENGEVTCDIVETETFILKMSSGSFYRIVTESSMDREKIASYNITILANDKGSPPLSNRKVITLDILDVNDNPPIFTKSTYVSYVPENNLPGASIYKIQASDLDIGENAKVRYSLNNTKAQYFSVSSFLSINIETGVLYAQRSFDYEQHKEFQVLIMAQDNGSPSLSSNTTLIIYIVDQNDNVPQILYPSKENDGSALFEMVSLSSEKGTLITKVVAMDADSGHNAWLSYHFIQVSELCPFSINQQTGEIRTSRIFQEKDALKHQIVVLVKDSGEPSLSTTVSLSLFIANNMQQVLPKLSPKIIDEDPQSNLQMYLVIALAVISFLFLVTVVFALISKYKESRTSPSFGSLSTNLYSHVDPRMLSKYNSGTLTLPHAYNVCVALDSSENDFTFLKPIQNVPVENLIDADESAHGNDKESVTSRSVIEVSANIPLYTLKHFIQFVLHGFQFLRFWSNLSESLV